MKNVLFVTYYWPPAGGVSTNRIVHFARYLEKYGWNVSVLTPSSALHPFKDESLIELVRDKTVYETGNLSLKRTKKTQSKDLIPYTFTEPSYSDSFKDWVKKWIKFNLIPDTRIFWSLFVNKKIKKVLADRSFDLIFSSSPPQTNHIIASRISKKYQIPWVADLRDPWSDVFWLKKMRIRLPIISWIDRVIEKRTLKSASALVTVTKEWENKYQMINPNTCCIYNGYNSEFHGSVKIPPKENEFMILYSGSISYQQNPSAFLHAVKEAINSNEDFKKKVKIVWLGNFPSFLKSMITEYDLDESCHFLPFTTMAESLQIMKQSDLLLSIGFGHDANTGVIHSKLFDYMAAKRPILGLGLEDEASEILEKSALGKSFQYSDNELIKNYVLEVFNNRNSACEINEPFIEEFSREAQTQQLAQIFDDVWSRRHH